MPRTRSRPDLISSTLPVTGRTVSSGWLSRFAATRFIPSHPIEKTRVSSDARTSPHPQKPPPGTGRDRSQKRNGLRASVENPNTRLKPVGAKSRLRSASGTGRGTGLRTQRFNTGEPQGGKMGKSLGKKVPVEGLEPPLPCGNQILNLARLPIPPHRHV